MSTVPLKTIDAAGKVTFLVCDKINGLVVYIYAIILNLPFICFLKRGMPICKLRRT